MANALFTTNDDDSNQGFDATPGQVLRFRLKTLPVSGVDSVRFQVWDASAFDPDEDILVNPPRKAKNSPSLTLVGATSGPSVAPVTLDGEVEVTLPNSDDHAWLVRCVVNGGKRTLPDGRLAFDPTLVHERMIVIRDADTGGRPIIATETTQYENDGWAVEAGRPGAAGPAGADGTNANGPATGSEDGFLQRIILTPADNGLTWATPEEIPPGNYLDFCGTGAGCGGRSGALNATNGSPISAQGGPGGGGGYRTPWFRFSRAFLIAQLPITFTIPSGGTGGAARSGTGVQSLAGALGSTPSGPTLMAGVNGVILRAFPGGPSSSANQAGPGGGAYSAGATTAGGRPNDVDNSTPTAIKTHGGCDRNTYLSTETSGAKQNSRHGGGGGGNSSSGGNAASCPGSESEFGGGGGAGAGGATSGTGAAQRAGTQGGGHDVTATGGTGTGGAAGAAGNLGHGSDGAPGDDLHAGTGGGSGGSSNNSGGAIAGDGGDGGDPGGGGGGGGAAANSFPGTTTNSSGAGGRGGHAEIRIIAWGPV